MTDLHLWLLNACHTCAHAICSVSWSSKKLHLALSRIDLIYCKKSTFYDGSLILKRHTAGWVLNWFFYESCGKTYDGEVVAV